MCQHPAEKKTNAKNSPHISPIYKTDKVSFRGVQSGFLGSLEHFNFLKTTNYLILKH